MTESPHGAPPTSRMLASDLDGTLIPPPGVDGRRGLAELSAAIRGAEGLRFAVVTGRHLSSALDGLTRHAIAEPDILVCDVGTSLYLRREGGYERDEIYRREMRVAMRGHSAADVLEALRGVPGMEPQEAERQSEFRASFYFDPRDRATVEVRAVGALSAAGLRVNPVLSRDPDTGRGLFDCLPRGVAKDYALDYLARSSGVAGRIITYAGGAGNDRAALLSGHLAILVGSASAELAADIRREVDRRSLQGRVYLATAGYADGVLEGCHHFGTL